MKSICIKFGHAWPVPTSLGYAAVVLSVLCCWSPAWAQQAAEKTAAPPKAADAAAKPAEQAPAEPKDAKEAEDAEETAIQKNQEERLKQAKKQEEAEPNKKVPRSVHIKRPGAPRPRLENYLQAEWLRADNLSPTEEDQFHDMRRGQTPPREPLIDKAAKAHVYSMTKPGDEDEISRKKADILKIIVDAKSGGNVPNEEFRRIYKRSLIKYAKDLLNNSLIVRINALILMGELYDGTADVPDAVPILMGVLKDSGQEDAVYYRTLRSLDAAKDSRQLTVVQERELIRDILQLADREEVQPILMEQLTNTLGKLGHAYSGNLPERADIATYLANIALDPDKSLRLRYVAAKGLGNVQQEAGIPGWNYELQTLVMCVFLKDMTLARIDGKLENSEVFRWWWWTIGAKLRELFGKPANRTNPKFQELIGVLAGLLNKIIDGKTEVQVSDLKPLEDWINAQQGISKKLAQDAKELEVFGVNPQAAPTGDNLK